MPELPSDSVRMPDMYNVLIQGIRAVVQFSHDDGFYGFALNDKDGAEVAFVGPWPEMKTCLGKLGQAIRGSGYWREEIA